MTRKKAAPTSVIIRVSPDFAKLVKAGASTASRRLGRRVSVVEYTHSMALLPRLADDVALALRGVYGDAATEFLFSPKET